MKYVCLPLVLLGALCCGASPPAVNVCVSSPDGWTHCGVGTTVAETPYLITAAHVLDGLGNGCLITLKTSEDRLVLAGAKITRDEQADVAILHVPILDNVGAKLCDPKINEKIKAQTLAGEKKGIVQRHTLGFIFTTVKLVAGDSGSAIVSIERECVIGLAIMSVSDPDTGVSIGSVGVDSSAIRGLIDGQ